MDRAGRHSTKLDLSVLLLIIMINESPPLPARVEESSGTSRLLVPRRLHSGYVSRRPHPSPRPHTAHCNHPCPLPFQANTTTKWLWPVMCKHIFPTPMASRRTTRKRGRAASPAGNWNKRNYKETIRVEKPILSSRAPLMNRDWNR